MLEKGLWGGGKTSVKATTYFCLLFLISITTFVIFSQNFVNAAPRKKRAASSGKVNKPKANSGDVKRAATTGNNKRAATMGNKRANTVRNRFNSRVKKGGSTTAPVVANTPATTATNVASSNVCPVGTFLKRKLNDETGDYTFYSAKTKECSLPEGDIVSVTAWEKANKASYVKALQVRPSWVSESEAAFLTCVPGYVEKTVNKVKTCVSALEICPINEIVEKSGKGYINLDTQEECQVPEKAVVRNVSGDENLLSYALEDEKAYKFECPANYYPVDDSETSIKVKCEMCPSGTSSPKGASSINDCSDGSVVQEEPEEPEQVVSVARVVNTEDDTAKLAKLRIKKVEGSEDDYECIDGWTNNWAMVKINNERVSIGNINYYVTGNFLRKDFIMDKDGLIKNVVDRNAYGGRNKKGCPIKRDYFYSLYNEGVKDGKRDYNNNNAGIAYRSFLKSNLSESVFSEVAKQKNIFNLEFYGVSISFMMCYTYESLSFATEFGVLKTKMESSDIDNTAVNGWTEEEYEAWDGYKPVIATYYDFSKLEGKKIESRGSCGEAVGYYIDFYGVKGEDVVNKLSKKNLFNYWN